MDSGALTPWESIQDIDDDLSRDDLCRIIKTLRDDIQDLLSLVIKLKKRKKRDVKDNYTYVMFDKNTGYYKIGQSTQPKIRERTLQSEKPTIEMYLCVKSSKEKESELHSKFREKRIRGEWFDLNESDLDYIKTVLK